MSALGADGKTPHGNDPQKEMYYPQNLDPSRRLPRTNRYLDEVEREKAEVARARVEGREPDLENPGPCSSSPRKTFAELDNPLNVNVASTLAVNEPDGVLESSSVAKKAVAKKTASSRSN